MKKKGQTKTGMGFLENTGYLARAEFLMDAFMHRLGLHGRSVPLFILGFGCNLPAIMATRILRSRRDRIVTTLLIPFILCAARTTIILALVAFVNYFIPCISTLAVIWKEMGKRIALISVLLNLSVAVLISWLVRILAGFFNWLKRNSEVSWITPEADRTDL